MVMVTASRLRGDTVQTRREKKGETDLEALLLAGCAVTRRGPAGRVVPIPIPTAMAVACVQLSAYHEVYAVSTESAYDTDDGLRIL
jgi:porphobilinogen deaminase